MTDIFAIARTLIEKHGWSQGPMREETGEFCLLGSIHAAMLIETWDYDEESIHGGLLAISMMQESFIEEYCHQELDTMTQHWWDHFRMPWLVWRRRRHGKDSCEGPPPNPYTSMKAPEQQDFDDYLEFGHEVLLDYADFNDDKNTKEKEILNLLTQLSNTIQAERKQNGRVQSELQPIH